MTVTAFLAEARTAIAGVLRLALFDRKAVDRFEDNLDACRRSFWACVIALPTLYVPLFMDIQAGRVPGDPVAVSIARGLGYVIGCAAFPLASLPVLAWLGRGQRWPRAIYGYNWLSLVQNAGATFLLLLSHAGVLGAAAQPILALFYLLCIAVEIFMFWAILEVGIAAPVALLLLDLLIGVVIDTMVGTVG